MINLKQIIISLYLLFHFSQVVSQSNDIIELEREQQVATFDTTFYDKLNLDEVVVTATRTPKKLSQSPVITQVLTSKQIESRGMSDIKNLLQQEIPGLSFNHVGFGASINLQGLGGKHILFLIDGERLAGETGNNIDYNRLNLNNIERIEIVHGAGSALYGSQAMGGIVNIITKKSDKKIYASSTVKWTQPFETNYQKVDKDDWRYYFKRSVDRPNFNADVNVGGKWRNWSAQSVFSFKSGDAYRLFDIDSVVKYFPQYDTTVYMQRNSTATNVSGFQSRNYAQSIHFAPSRNLNFTLKGSYYTQNQYDLYSDNKHEYNTDMSGTFNTTYRFGGQSLMQMSVHTDTYSKLTNFELLDTGRILIYRNTITQPRILYTTTVGAKHTINTGLEFLSEDLFTDRFIYGKYESRYRHNVSYFVQDDWLLATRFSAIAGVRVDYDNAYGFNWSPKFALLYKLFPFTFRFNYAAGYRSPTLKELYMNWDHLGMFMIYGNKDLRPEYNNYLSISTEFVSDKFYALLMGYLNMFSDKIEGIWSNNQTELHYRNVKSDILSGLNANLRYNPVGKLFVHLSTNYLYPGKSRGVRLNSQSTLSGTIRTEFSIIAGHTTITCNLSGAIFGHKRYSVLETLMVNGVATEAYYRAYVPAYSLWNATIAIRLFSNATLTAGVDNLFNYRAKIINFNTYTGPGRNFFVSLNLHI